MTDLSPGVDEMTAWRSLLDGLGQAAVGWRAVEERIGDGAVELPTPLVESLARAGQEAAEVLSGLAGLLAGRDDPGEGLRAVAHAQAEAAQAWARAREQVGHGDGPGDIGESGTDQEPAATG